MSQVTGIVKVYLNGALQRSKEGAKLKLGGKERTAQVGHAVYGFSEKVVPSELEFTLSHMPDTDLIALRDLTGATARFECDSGTTYVIPNAFVSEPPELTGGDGDVGVKMMGDPAFEE